MEKVDAIYTLERLAHTEAKWPGTEETLEALDMAVKALRLIATVDHFPDSTKMIHDSDFVDTNKMVLLTLDQLRAMDRPTPVWAEVDGKTIEGWDGYWCLCHKGKILAPSRLVTQSDCMDGVEFYAYPPAHIDREAWEPCGACKNGEITIHVPEFRAMAVCNQHMDHEAFDLTLRLKFCPWCGRPLTLEAWDELEQRLRGEQVDERERDQS